MNVISSTFHIMVVFAKDIVDYYNFHCYSFFYIISLYDIKLATTSKKIEIDVRVCWQLDVSLLRSSLHTIQENRAMTSLPTWNRTDRVCTRIQQIRIITMCGWLSEYSPASLCPVWPRSSNNLVAQQWSRSAVTEHLWEVSTGRCYREQTGKRC